MAGCCCFSGHRNVPQKELVSLKIELDRTIRTLAAKGVHDYYCGAARGFDMLAAEAVLHLKQGFPDLRLFLILPCKSQTAFWSDSDKQRYSYILSHADDVQCLYENYNRNCMYERNKELIKAATICVCYLKEEKSGTAFTVALAAKHHLTVLPLGLSEEEKAHFEERFLGTQLPLENLEFGI